MLEDMLLLVAAIVLAGFALTLLVIQARRRDERMRAERLRRRFGQ